MGSLIYAPGVQVYIRTASGRTLDVSDDLTRGQVVRRSDGVSTAAFSLQNARRKYDEMFTPGDRVVILAKRLAWMRVFTGLLNVVPLVSIWPQEVDLEASCTLKRAQYWFWNPLTQATQTMISQAFASAAGDSSTSDGGAGAAALAIMDKVMGWPSSKAHIGAIPTRWLDLAYKVAQQVQASEGASDRLAAQFYSNLTAGGIVAGVPQGPAISGVLKGSYGPFTDPARLRNAEIIFSVGVSKGASLPDITVALMTSMAASGLVNTVIADRFGGLGLFDQVPAQGWGTPEQVLNPTYAASVFYDRLLAIGNRSAMAPGDQARTAARPVTPTDYASWASIATSMVNDITTAQGQTVAGSNTPLPRGFSPNSRPQGTSSGTDYATTAVAFVHQFPTIPYTEGYPGTQMNVISASPPPGLDCSSFVQASYLRTLGGLYDCPRVASDQSAWCVQMLSAADGLKTAGALMFKGPGKGSAYHVEVSLGDGQSTVGSHHSGTYASVNGGGGPYWDYAGLPPRLSFDHVGGGNGVSAGAVLTPGAAGAAAAPVPTTFSSTPGYNPNDKFDKLFGDKAWIAVSSYDATNSDYILANSLSGARALLDDQPLLPYLKQLFNASMRSFCSAPNGDLVAWFPDYYGLWGSAPVMTIEAIECKDFTVKWSDDFLVTHQFTSATPGVGAGLNSFDPATGTLSGTGIDPSLLVFNSSVASIDIPAVMYALFGIDATPADAANFAAFIYRRFGARPDYQAVPGLVGPSAGFFAALYLFMRQWAFQYSASVPLTWMPEVWPGMLLRLPWADFQCYVNAVTHTFKMGKDGSFTTEANVAAPARMPRADDPTGHVLLGMPLAGGFAAPATPAPSRGPAGPGQGHMYATF